MDIQRLGREGKAESQIFHNLHDAVVDLLLDALEVGEGGGLGKVHQRDFQAAVLKAVEADDGVVGKNLLVGVDHFGDAGDTFFHLLFRGIIGQSDGEGGAALVHSGPVGNGGGHQRRVWYNHQSVREGADAGGAEGDVLDNALDIWSRNPVIDRKRFVQQDDQTAKEVLRRILCCQCEGQTSQTKTGDDGGDIGSGFTEDSNGGKDNQKHIESLFQKGHQRFVEVDIQLFVQLVAKTEEGVRGTVAQSQKNPGDDDDDADAVHLQQEMLHTGRRIQVDQSQIDAAGGKKAL